LDLSWVSGSNSIAGSDGKPNNNEDTIKDLGKELEKEQLISSSINTSQPLFKMERKVDITPYQGDIDVVRLSH
jgi:hypothetical protein